MTAHPSDASGHAHELRISVTDDVYEQLQMLAADQHVPAEEYAARMLADDVARVRFVEGARSFIAEHSHGFADRFGPHPAGEQAA
ncbi:hypothetical protein ACWGDX_29695 [Streptomyces sp. NPDC055025]